MNNTREILGLILARGGSKSIPKKSIATCAGYPLMYYTIKAAQGARSITRLIISTDDDEMAAIAREHGVEVPFMRPKELAEDLTPDLPVFQHALKWLRDREGYVPDAVVHLRPTTPLKSSRDIDRGVEILLGNTEAHSVRSVCLPEQTPFKMYHLEEGSPFLTPVLRDAFPQIFEKNPEAYNMPRQSLPKIWKHSGHIDVIRPEIILEQSSMSGTNILPLFFEQWRDMDIDEPKDLRYANFFIKELREEGRVPWEE